MSGESVPLFEVAANCEVMHMEKSCMSILSSLLKTICTAVLMRQLGLVQLHYVRFHDVISENVMLQNVSF